MRRSTRWARARTASLAGAVAAVLVAAGAPSSVGASRTDATDPLLPTVVTAAWSTGPTVHLRERASVTGRVVGGEEPRVVALQQHTYLGWDDLATTTTADGYTLRIPTSWVAEHTLRVVVRPSSTYDGAVAARVRDLRVTPSYEPAGSAHAYRLLRMRFDPCQPIVYRVNRERMPPGALGDLATAIRRLSVATGLTFTYDGSTRVVPWRGSGQREPGSQATIRGFDLAIGWAVPRQVPDLAGAVVGLGGVSRTDAVDAAGWWRADTAEVVFDATYRATPGFGPRGFNRGQLMLHELGHAVGLDHTDGADQIMSYHRIGPKVYGAGDLAGLARVGRSAGCFVATSTWRPGRPVDAPGPG